MLTTLITETGSGQGFPVTGLITVLVAAAIFYPVQKKVRAIASRHRRERWVEAGLLTEEEQDPAGQESPGPLDPDSPPADDLTLPTLPTLPTPPTPPTPRENPPA